MATWAPGDEITAAKLNLASVFVEDAIVTSTTSGTFNNTTRVLSVTITAPASGRIEAILAVRCDNNPSPGANTLSDLLIVGSVSGTIYSPSNDAACQWNGFTSAGPFSTARQVACSPGETVTITAQHKVIGGTGNFRYRSITAKALVS